MANSNITRSAVRRFINCLAKRYPVGAINDPKNAPGTRMTDGVKMYPVDICAKCLKKYPHAHKSVYHPHGNPCPLSVCIKLPNVPDTRPSVAVSSHQNDCSPRRQNRKKAPIANMPKKTAQNSILGHLGGGPLAAATDVVAVGEAPGGAQVCSPCWRGCMLEAIIDIMCITRGSMVCCIKLFAGVV